MLFNSSNNRNAQHRKDQNFVEKAFQSEQALIVVWYKGKLLIQEHQFELFSFQQINELGVDTQNKIYLASEEPNKENKNNDKTFHYFSINLLNWNDKLNHFELFDLRTASPFLTENILSLLFYAQGLNNWHHNNPFCSQCGSQTEIKQFGHVRQCLNGDCQKEHFPRTDPAVIFTIINKQQKDERILLARQGSWDENRYSVVAGFVEPGESLEDAVRREALEEVGVHVFNVKYQMSQPWPFPASIMLG
ncbi:MAG: NAD(+) diphosphatase, partial [Gammaproteobacteria bacterium]|nr:NAD(+) diphosphatase [Gammaproteobacteria bacterium]